MNFQITFLLNWPSVGVALLLAFHCPLRPGEVVALLRKHLLLPCDGGCPGDRGVVLFHLNQVWTGGDSAVPYKDMQDMVLPEFLPVGSMVMVNMSDQ